MTDSVEAFLSQRVLVHICHAIGCKRPVPPAQFACRQHWGMLPAPMRNAIWNLYRVGQEFDKRPSAEYVEAANAARHWLHEHEGRPGTLCVVCIEQP